MFSILLCPFGALAVAFLAWKDVRPIIKIPKSLLWGTGLNGIALGKSPVEQKPKVLYFIIAYVWLLGGSDLLGKVPCTPSVGGRC